MAQEPFGDIPLFREIQKLLSSSQGPVNFEIARQVAGAVATQGLSDTDIDSETSGSFRAAVQEAERLVAGFTRIAFDEVARVEMLGRARWVDSTIASWGWLLEHLASHFTRELGRAEGESSAGILQGAIGQVAPLLIGVQAGTLVGHLGRGALARYDYPIPRDDDSHLFFVAPGVRQVASDYDLEPQSLARWLSLHECARHVVMTARPWVARYLRSLLTEVVDATEIDTGDLERRLMELQTKGMEGLQGADAPESALPIVSTERHRKASDRLNAFVAAFEGYASHVEKEVGKQLLDNGGRVAESIVRFRATHGEAEALLGSVLGIAVDRDLESAGATFCAAVVSLRNLTALNEIWTAPDNLPTMAEIKDPFAWMERVLDG